MGWWTLPDDDEVHLGDEVMDATYDYLETLSKLYVTRLKRNPTIGELQAIWRLALRVNGDRCVDDHLDRQVDAVSVKVSKRPKKQKYQVGDVFVVPLKRSRYVFGRIINLADGWDLVEFFPGVHKSPNYSPEVIKGKRLMPPIWISMDEAFGDWAWKIVDSTPGYQAPDLDTLKYARGLPGNYQLVKVGDFQPRGRLSEKEGEALPKRIMYLRESAIDEIEEALAQKKPH